LRSFYFAGEIAISQLKSSGRVETTIASSKKASSEAEVAESSQFWFCQGTLLARGMRPRGKYETLKISIFLKFIAEVGYVGVK